MQTFGQYLENLQLRSNTQFTLGLRKALRNLETQKSTARTPEQRSYLAGIEHGLNMAYGLYSSESPPVNVNPSVN